MFRRAIVAMLIACTLSAGFDNLPSLEGFSGALHTPNAITMEEGSIDISANNYLLGLPLLHPASKDKITEENYFMGIGFLPYTELYFRYSFAKDSTTDKLLLSDRMLSGKLSLDGLFKQKNLHFAIGVVDPIGGAQRMRSIYGVTSFDFASARVSIGYGTGNKNALNGLFGSVEIEPTSHLQFATEYDSKSWHIGGKLFVKNKSEKIGATIDYSTTTKNTYIGFFAQKRFGSYKHIGTFEKIPHLNFAPYSMKKMTIKKNKKRYLYVIFENDQYLYNNIKTLSLLFGSLSTSKEDVDMIEVLETHFSIPIADIIIDKKKYLHFLKTGEIQDNTITFGELKSPSVKPTIARPIVIAEPEIKLVDGSEYGHFDYNLALRLSGIYPLYAGLNFEGSLYLPISQSYNFKRGIFAYRNRFKHSAVFDRALISYCKRSGNGKMQHLLLAGEFEKKLYGVSYEARYNIDNDDYIGAKISYLKDDLYKEMDRYGDTPHRKELLLKWGHYSERFDSFFSAKAGRFLYNDKGIMLTWERDFGNTRISFDVAYEKHPVRGTNKIARLRIDVPLGDSSIYHSKFVDFSLGNLKYKRQKTIVPQGKMSYAQPMHLHETGAYSDIDHLYTYKNRTMSAYIRSHLKQIRYEYLKEIFGAENF